MAIPKLVTLGGRSRGELRDQLRAASVNLNRYAEELLASDLFTVSAEPYSIRITEISVEKLGFPDGATTQEILLRAAETDLEPGPLELGPFLRLQYRDQPETGEQPLSGAGQAPEGAITVVSLPMSAESSFPKGFYLRRVNGVLWLRGYSCGDDHRWAPRDRLVFARSI